MSLEDTTVLTLSTDDFTRFNVSISGDHAYIHKGYAFTYPEVFSLVGNATVDFMFTTPAAAAGKYIHFRPIRIGTTASGCQYSVYENPTFTAGTNKSSGIFNRNRNSANAPTAIIKGTNLSVSNAGTLLFSEAFGGTGNPASNRQGITGQDEEIVFKSDEDYLLRITNLTATDTIITVNIFWYEEPL